MQSLGEQDLQRIAAAVAEAERTTSGEIVCSVARQVSSYPEVPVTWAAACALVLPPLALAVGLRPLAVSSVFGQWVIAHLSSLDDTVAVALSAFVLIQAAVFAMAWLVFSIPPVRRALTPAWIKHARVREAAYAQYAATGLPARSDLTGVVIFTSLDDRRVEVIADPLIHAKMDAQAWDPVAAAVVDGMRHGRPADGLIKAVTLCGEILSRHFPDDGQPNGFSDQPIVS